MASGRRTEINSAPGGIGQNQPVAPYPRGTLPRAQPIIPTWRKEPFDDPDWLFDFKYDGFRGLCYLEQGRCRFISRNGNVLSRFEAFGDQVAAALESTTP
jgi:ATP-dependent DNA ligase